MSAQIIDGKAIAEEVRREVAAAVAEWVAAGNERPGLATVLVGEDPASAVYVGGKQKATHEVGMQGFDHRLAADTPQEEVEALLRDLNADTRVSGILQLLLARNATVTVCHSRTRDLPAVCARADVLVAAVGRPRMVQGDWVKPGAVVIDVGINRTDDGLVGDVDFDAAAERAALITPVPRGVGPMTIAMLLRNTLQAARAAAGAPA